MSAQKRHAYTGDLNSETCGHTKNSFLHCGDVLVVAESWLESYKLDAVMQQVSLA